MGISNFNSWLQEYIDRYSKIIVKVGEYGRSVVENLYVEMNPLIYWAINLITARDEYDFKDKINPNIDFYYILSSFNDRELYQTIENIVWKMLVDIYNSFRPTHNFVLVFDGVPPLSKIQEQRQRRYEKVQESDESDIDSNIKLIRDKIDTNMITPGTKFMDSLDKFMRYRLDKEKDMFTSTKRIIYSSYKSRGEGEHKIFNFLKSFNVKEGKYNVIYGEDSDLSIISLLHQYISSKELRIILSRKSVIHNIEVNDIFSTELKTILTKRDVIHNIDKNFQIKRNERDDGIDIDEDKDIEISELSEFIKNDLNIEILDFILIIMFVGNDFLPKMPFLRIPSTRITTILSAYDLLESDDPIVTNDEIEIDGIIKTNYIIDWDLFLRFILILAYNEKLMGNDLVEYLNRIGNDDLDILTERFLL